MEDTRTAAGLKLLAKIEGSPQPSIVAALADVAPDLAQLAIGFAYGEIYGRPGLDLPQRQLVTISALAAMGGLEPQLRFHVAGALNAGCRPQQLVELMIHLVVYAGFPAALNGTAVLRQVFQERGVVVEPTAPKPPHDTFEAGMAALREIDGEAGEKVISSLKDISPDLGRSIIDFAFGQVYTREGLDLHQRELITVASLAAIGCAIPQLKVHTHGFLNVGGTREQLVEIAIQIAAYAGFPRAINAALAIQDVLRERAKGH
jgi:4-carboxymuconolactone decarboxylase